MKRHACIIGSLACLVALCATPAQAQYPNFVPILASPGVLAPGFSATGNFVFTNGYIYLQPGATVSFTLTVPSGQTQTVAYGLLEGHVVNNGPVNVSVNGMQVATITGGIGAYYQTTPTNVVLWSDSFTPGSYTITLTSVNNSVNVYGFWFSNPPSIGSSTPVPPMSSVPNFVQILASPGVFAQGFSATGNFVFTNGYIYLCPNFRCSANQPGSSASYTLVVPAGQTQTVAYGLRAGHVVNNGPVDVSVDGVQVATITNGIGGFGQMTPVDLLLWGQTLGPGTHTITLTPVNNSVNVYGLWFGTQPTEKDFQLAVSPPSQTVQPSGSTSFLIQVIPLNGFDGQVTVQPPLLPTGFNSTFLPSSIVTDNTAIIQPGTSATLEISAAPTVAGSTFPVTISATSSGGTTHSQLVNLSVSGTVKGVQNTINLKSFSVSSATCPTLGTNSCFSIQQNMIVEDPDKTSEYLAQNTLIVEDVAGINLAYRFLNLYQFPDLMNPVECFPENCHPTAAVPLFFSPPATWTLTTKINSSNKLVMTNPLGTRTLVTAMPTDAVVDLGGGGDTRMPELVLVGWANGVIADFDSSTSGTVESSLEMSDGSWSSSLTLIPHNQFDALTLETSAGLQWMFAGSNTASFGASGIPAEGVGFVPSTPVTEVTIQGGQASVDQMSSTGVSVAVTGSTAPDGTLVTIATAAETSQPPGTGELNLGSAGFYDVLIQGIADGTARVCVSNEAVSADTTMLYWDATPKYWSFATSPAFTANPPNTLCGDIAVSALAGTPIAIGPLSPGTVPGVHLVTTVQSLTLSSANQYVAVINVSNLGSNTANNVAVTASELNSTSTSTVLPVSLGNLSYGASAAVTLTYPASAGRPGSSGVLQISVKYTGGSAGGGSRVTLP